MTNITKKHITNIRKLQEGLKQTDEVRAYLNMVKEELKCIFKHIDENKELSENTKHELKMQLLCWKGSFDLAGLFDDDGLIDDIAEYTGNAEVRYMIVPYEDVLLGNMTTEEFKKDYVR